MRRETDQLYFHIIFWKLYWYEKTFTNNYRKEFLFKVIDT